MSGSQNGNMMRMVQQVMNGDQSMVITAISQTLPELRGHLTDLRAEVEYREEHEWDVQGSRQAAMGGNVTTEQTVGAWSDLMGAALRLTSRTPLLLSAPDAAVEEYRELWIDALYEFVLTLHNPVVKYGIIGGFEPPIREDAEQYFERFGTEIWGTLLAVTQAGEIDVTDFPPETRSVIEQVAAESDADTAGQGGESA